MIAIDTNVLVRFLVADDPSQAKIAKRLFIDNEITIPHTVLLETEWVLRRSYGFAPERVAVSFLHLLGIPTVFCDRKDSVLCAVHAVAEGCDFADALHAATADRRIRAFATFEESFARNAQGVTGLPPIELIRNSPRV